MDISLTRQPQDGFLSFEACVDLRISTIPTINGEDIAIRIADRRHGIRSIDTLSFGAPIADELKKLCQLDSGLILITGSTGSGKTTTLYALIDHIRTDSTRAIVTLEDPVEYPIDGIRQIPVQRNSTFNFSDGIRAVLRQDPDVIMIGEIRDRETAVAAIEAAYTGHLVLSSLHTSTIEATLGRLHHFNLDPFWVGQSIQGIMSQRLDIIHCECVSGCVLCNETQVIGRKVSASLASFNEVGDRSSLAHAVLPEECQVLST